MSAIARSTGGGVELELELERADLIPGQLVAGALRVLTTKEREIRGALVSLIGTEHWKHEVSQTNAQGHTTTRIVRSTAELPRVPIQLSGPATLTAGLSRKMPFELPVPALGPPTVTADASGLEWILEAKLDVPWLDPGVVLPVTIHQPTALLRAGVVPVEQFALWPSVDAQADGIRASIAIEPVPLDLGGPLEGRVSLELDKPLDVQGIRAELRVEAAATVSRGVTDRTTIWSHLVREGGRMEAGHHELTFSGTVPDAGVPTARLPHGRTSGRLHLVFDVRWAADPHLDREVAIATTTEV